MLIRLAPLVKRAAIFAGLKKFAFGERGSDALRMQAVLMLSEAGHIEGRVEMWREGELQLVQLMSQEIFGEPTVELPPEVHELMIAAHEAIHDGRGAEAERLLREGLRSRPDDASMQYNRAVAIGLQGREAEALEIVRRIHRQHPDYVFARTRLADQCIDDGDLEQAQTLLAPIAQKQRLHTSEYAAWCSANINLALAMGDRKMARSLLGAWEQIDPDDHRIEIWKGRIRGGIGPLAQLNRLIGRAREDAK
jgi:tetratricopeptide (TPR) repeat protein